MIAGTRHKSKYETCGKSIAVAVSGGVDSGVAAKLMSEEGFDVFGITMKFLPEIFNFHIKTARMITDRLNIPFVEIDLTDEFEKIIIKPFCSNYLQGKTPNPCIECNKFIKFGLLLEKAKSLGASFLATGHYCIVSKSPATGLFEVKKAFDRSKDQSYVFWKLNQEQLSYIKTPLGMLTKKEIKNKASKLYTFLEGKSESQEICFIPNNNYRSFLLKRFKNIKEGKILNTKGEIIGKHKGYPFYTVGQRRGLGVSYKKPIYVKEIIPDKNIIIAGEDKDLYQKKFIVNEVNFISGTLPEKSFRANVKIRYIAKENPAQVNILGKDTAEVIFDKPQRAVTPGQSAVFYKKDFLIGGGVIAQINLC